MPHFLFASFLYEPILGGGASIVPYDLSQRLNETGNNITIITTSANRKLHIENINGIKIYRFPPNNIYWILEKDNKSILQKAVWQLMDIWNPMFYNQVKKILTEIKPDIVHVHKLRGFSPSLWNAAHACGIPVVHTCHDFELISPQGTLGGRIGQMALNQSWLLRPYQSIRRKASKSVNAFTAPSRILLETHSDLGFFPNAVHQVIPNSHGYNRAQLARYAAKSNKNEHGHRLKILFIGRIHHDKGIHDLLKAFSAAYELDNKLSLDIAGDGPVLQELMSQYKGHGAINFHGFVSGEKKENLLTGCDILIFPSIVREGLGIAILEALAHGKPVIATRCGGPEEILEEGVSGFLVDPGQPEVLKDRILSISLHIMKLMEMREACHKTAQKYSIENNVESYMSIYQRLMNG